MLCAFGAIKIAINNIINFNVNDLRSFTTLVKQWQKERPEKFRSLKKEKFKSLTLKLFLSAVQMKFY